MIPTLIIAIAPPPMFGPVPLEAEAVARLVTRNLPSSCRSHHFFGLPADASISIV